MDGWSHYSWEYEILKVTEDWVMLLVAVLWSPGAHHAAPDIPFLVMVVTSPAGQFKPGYLRADANS